MKIIEGMKRIKELNIKCQDLKSKVEKYAADLDFENPTYPDQKGQIREWVQSYQDSVKEMERLKLAVQKTNLATSVVVEIADKKITKSIAAWILRRRKLAKMDASIWQSLTDRGMKDGSFKQTDGTNREVKVRRYFDVKEKDQKVVEYNSEPMIIDRTLEVINCITELME